MVVGLIDGKLTLQLCVLTGLGISLSTLSALISGTFPFYGEARSLCLLVSTVFSILLLTIILVNPFRKKLGFERGNSLAIVGVIMILVVFEYRYLIEKQDELIANITNTIGTNISDYELLSNIPDDEAIEILANQKVSKRLCGVQYLLGFFYLCAYQPHRTIEFMISIEPAPRLKRSIRVSERGVGP
jgi:hypothetical protein